MRLLVTLIASCAVFCAAKNSYDLVDLYLVPHSHCDAGWLLTDETYFSYDWPAVGPAHQGAGGSVRRALDTITDTLTADPSLRFVWAETIWLAKWWPLQSDEVKARFRRLVDNGQLEFVGGGWVQNDEVNIPYTDVVEQTTAGHEFLLREFNVRPRIGWQLDMFAGYSSVTPSLWAMAGYSEMVLRYEGNATMRAQWEAARHFEYVWHASGSLSYNRSSIFAHVINGNYGDLCGQGFDWEHPNTTKNPPVTPDNVQSRATLFSAYIRAQAQSYRGPPFMLLWGADFHFHNSPVQFGNMSALVREINAHPATYGLRVRYSTATEYFNALHSSSSTPFPLVHNNVNFELGWPHKISGYSAPLTYQTGTASSWPQYKQRVRACAALMRATDALLAFITDTLTPTDCNQLTHVHQALALVQHHDSVPGTMRTSVSSNTTFYIGNEDVLSDYQQHLSDAVRLSVHSLIPSALSRLIDRYMTPRVPVDPSQLYVCDSPAYSLPIAHSESTLLIFNPVSLSEEKRIVTLKIDPSLSPETLTIVNAHNEPVPFQTDPFDSQSILFLTQIPSLGVALCGLSFSSQHPSTQSQTAHGKREESDSYQLDNSHLTVYFNRFGELKAIFDKESEQNITIEHQMGSYTNATGGAYIMFDDKPADMIARDSQFAPDFVSGSVLGSLCVSGFQYDVERVCYTLYAHEKTLSVTHTLGTPKERHEVISRFRLPDWPSAEFSIDESGFEMSARQFNGSESIPANYHAMVSSATLKTERAALGVVSSYTMGVASLSASETQMEVMLARRLNTPDSQGPWPLDDTSHVTATLSLCVGEPLKVERLRQRQIVKRAHPPVTTALDMSLKAFNEHYAPSATSFSLLATPLDPSLTLLTLSPVCTRISGDAHNTSLVRVHHMYEKKFEPRAASVDLQTLFNIPSTTRLTELSLTANQRESDIQRRVWPVDQGQRTRTLQVASENGTQTIDPLDIRTYYLHTN